MTNIEMKEIENTLHLYIKVEKGTYINEFLLQIRDEFIDKFNEERAEEINRDLLLHLFIELMIYNGVKETKKYINTLIHNAQKAYVNSLS